MKKIFIFNTIKKEKKKTDKKYFNTINGKEKYHKYPKMTLW